MPKTTPTKTRTTSTASTPPAAAKLPTIGRIVLYVPSADDIRIASMADTPHPAIVTSVDGDQASLFVMFGAVKGTNGTMCVASAKESAAGEPGTWSWPPRAS